jgi:hypothetical protein
MDKTNRILKICRRLEELEFEIDEKGIFTSKLIRFEYDSLERELENLESACE